MTVSRWTAMLPIAMCLGLAPAFAAPPEAMLDPVVAPAARPVPPAASPARTVLPAPAVRPTQAAPVMVPRARTQADRPRKFVRKFWPVRRTLAAKPAIRRVSAAAMRPAKYSPQTFAANCSSLYCPGSGRMMLMGVGFGF